MPQRNNGQKAALDFQTCAALPVLKLQLRIIIAARPGTRGWPAGFARDDAFTLPFRVCDTRCIERVSAFCFEVRDRCRHGMTTTK